MAVVKGILVNDGGATARIMNFLAGEAVSAGEALKMHTDGKAMLATSGLVNIIGFALTDAASGAQVSCITGSGVMLYAITDAVTVGDELAVDAAKPGFLETKLAYSDGVAESQICAIALETNATTNTLTKVMVI